MNASFRRTLALVAVGLLVWGGWHGWTNIFIYPGYKFKAVDALITNFHQPKSTLLLLVSALIGEKWKEVYQHALDNDFRFLSYGDSCFFTMHNS